MPDLVPNGPKERIAYVIKTYRGTKTRFIIPEVIEASLSLIGQDAVAATFRNAYDPLWRYLFNYDKQDFVHQMRDDGLLGPGLREPTEEELEGYVGEQFDDMPRVIEAMAPTMPRHHPLDFVIPWMAKELNRLGKAVRGGAATGRDFEEAATKLNLVGPAIGMWAQQNRVDLTKTTLAEALEAIKDFEVDVDEDVPQGAVVYEFGDGWTIQRLTTEEQLDAEGETMQHCVGGYCEQVATGSTVILSLRDPQGAPHATIEWRPKLRSGLTIADTVAMGLTTREDILDADKKEKESSASRLERIRSVGIAPVESGDGKFVQIRGKQNETPAEKYRERIQRFIEERFDSDPLGMLMVALKDQIIDFSGREIRDVDFEEADVSMSQARFSGARFVSVRFGHLVGVMFDGSAMERCSFGDSVDGCSFSGVKMKSVDFDGDIDDCGFDSAVMEEVTIGGLSLLGCSFVDVEWHSCSWGNSNFVNCDLTNNVFADGMIEDVDLDRCTMDGFELKNPVRVGRVTLRDIDLIGVGLRTVYALYRGTGNGPYGGIRAFDVEWPEGFDPEKALSEVAN